MTGDILKAARERNRLTVKDIEQATSIRSTYIEAIEKGDYDKLPGEVYAKGFIKNYANFLKLDGESLVREFISEINPRPINPEEVVTDASESLPEVTAAPAFKNSGIKITELKSPNVKIRSRREEKSSSSSGGSFIIAATVMIAALAGGAWYLLTSGVEGTETASVNPQVQVEQQAKDEVTGEVQQVEVPAPVPASGTAQATTPAATAENTAPANDVNVQAVFSDQCWTRVNVDGAIVYEGMVNPGQTLNWSGRNSVKVRVGNAGAVTFAKNGQNMGVAGNPGAVVEKTFTK